MRNQQKARARGSARAERRASPDGSASSRRTQSDDQVLDALAVRAEQTSNHRCCVICGATDRLNKAALGDRPWVWLHAECEGVYRLATDGKPVYSPEEWREVLDYYEERAMRGPEAGEDGPPRLVAWRAHLLRLERIREGRR